MRTGNAAVTQFQLDVYGEVMDALHKARQLDIEAHPSAWALQRALLDFLEGNWQRPDEGIWEVRGPRRHFTSKVLAWVAMDRAVKAVEDHGHDGPVDRWRRVRDEIHQQVCANAYDPDRKTFTQYYGSQELDASLLLMPLVGFLPRATLGSGDHRGHRAGATAGRVCAPLSHRAGRGGGGRASRPGGCLLGL